MEGYLNKEDQELLDSILKKGKHELTENDKIILNARKSYVSETDWKRLMETLEVKVAPLISVKTSDKVVKK